MKTNKTKKRLSLTAVLTLALLPILAVGLGVSAQGPATQESAIQGSAQGSAQEPGTAGVLSPSASVGTAFTYQGYLEDTSGPVDGTCDFQFTLYDADVGGSPVGSTQTENDVTVTDGYFTVPGLDFGTGIFAGQARHMEVAVNCGDGYTTLSPRVALNGTPYALYALGAPWGGLVNVPSDLDDGDDDTLGGLSCANGQVAKWTGSAWTCGDVGSGSGWSLTGNAGTDPGSNYIGTSDAVSLTLGVNSVPALRIEFAGATPNLVGGSSANSVTAGVEGATIGGGGDGASPNQVTDDYGTVGGGANNQAGDGDTNTGDATSATVAGGEHNTASGWWATIGGGHYNTASGLWATIGGGDGNTASGDSATIGGGDLNTASGQLATVSGGNYNTASRQLATIGGGLANQVDGQSATIGGGEYISVTGQAATVAGGSYITVTGDYAAVGGGQDNVVTATYATVGGGYGNYAGGDESTIGGGIGNHASGSRATVGGGDYNYAIGYESTVGGGYYNVAIGYESTVGGGGDNEASGDWSTVGGGDDNEASSYYATVGGGRFNTASGYESVIGGGFFNEASSDNATIGGGGWNEASGQLATVGGGGYNTASGDESTVGGGYRNVVTATYATVAGGSSITVTGSYAAVGGGEHNTANGYGTAIGGGENNTASGYYAAVPGGRYNTAGGSYSFAAGRRAKANNAGCFVWADSTDADVTCNSDDRTIFRASGGFYIYTSSDRSKGMYLAANTETWAQVSASDRNLKENFEAVDNREVLARLAEVPITTWNYKGASPDVRHMSPMAQDFYATFGLGDDDTHLGALDTNGVALAAIQGLYAQNQELLAENAALQAKVNDLDARLTALEENPQASSSLGRLGAVLLGGLAVVAGVVAGVVVQRRRQGGDV